MISLQDIPKKYTVCFAGKGTCPKAPTCLRAIAAQLLGESEGRPSPVIDTVNPIYIERLSPAEDCICYRSSEPARFAKGMTRLFDEVPLKQAHLIRLRVMRCFSCESFFYHSRRGTRLISPAEQEAILHVFRSAELDITPQYDEFRYEVDW